MNKNSFGKTHSLQENLHIFLRPYCVGTVNISICHLGGQIVSKDYTEL